MVKSKGVKTDVIDPYLPGETQKIQGRHQSSSSKHLHSAQVSVPMDQ